MIERPRGDTKIPSKHILVFNWRGERESADPEFILPVAQNVLLVPWFLILLNPFIARRSVALDGSEGVQGVIGLSDNFSSVGLAFPAMLSYDGPRSSQKKKGQPVTASEIESLRWIWIDNLRLSTLTGSPHRLPVRLTNCRVKLWLPLGFWTNVELLYAVVVGCLRPCERLSLLFIFFRFLRLF